MSIDQPYNEHELLSRIAEGDEQAFSVLFRHEYPAVYNAALLVTANASLAEEVVQDVFLKIWLKRRDLINVHHFRGYLFIIARNQAYRALKKQIRWQSIHTNHEAGDETLHLADLKDNLLPAQIWEIFEEAVSQLPQQQQRAFRMARVKGMKRDDVAAAMNLSSESVKKYLAAASLKVRAYCQAHYPELFTEIAGLLVIMSFSR